MWLVKSEKGMEPTNNRAERALRYPVICRKRSLCLGTWSEKSDRWVERILYLKHTCRRRDLSTCLRFTLAIAAHLVGQPTTLPWISALA
ncbi:MAG: transposase [Proteobacteria bacterium]|nr:transposase [Pseudomonadota bacterium]